MKLSVSLKTQEIANCTDSVFSADMRSSFLSVINIPLSLPAMLP